MIRLVLTTALLLSAVVWYLGLTWCAPAFLAIAYGCVLVIVQAWRVAGEVTRGERR